MELLLLLLIIFLQLKEEEGRFPGAASPGAANPGAARCKPSPAWPRLPHAGHKCSMNMARQREMGSLQYVSECVLGVWRAWCSILHPAPQEF